MAAVHIHIAQYHFSDRSCPGRQQGPLPALGALPGSRGLALEAHFPPYSVQEGLPGFWEI